MFIDLETKEDIILKGEKLFKKRCICHFNRLKCQDCLSFTQTKTAFQ